MSARIPTETPRRGKAHRLERATFKTSRLLDFVGERELTAQIGHPADEWPAVILKELMDNAIDACEEAEVAPSLSNAVSSSKGTITITDNGPGIDTATVTDILDYTVRVSSREAYVSPTRGAQGNALKTILAMGFALTGERGETIIESRGTRHRIVFAVDRIRQQPRIERPRQIMYAARPEILRLTGKSSLDDRYFTQTLLPDFMEQNPELCGSWDVVWDARGHFTEPHTQQGAALGTLEVRQYLGLRPERGEVVSISAAELFPTHGP